MCENFHLFYFIFIHSEAVTHIDNEQITTTATNINNKSNNLKLTNDEQINKRITIKYTDLKLEQDKKRKNYIC